MPIVRKKRSPVIQVVAEIDAIFIGNVVAIQTGARHGKAKLQGQVDFVGWRIAIECNVATDRRTIAQDTRRAAIAIKRNVRHGCALVATRALVNKTRGGG